MRLRRAILLSPLLLLPLPLLPSEELTSEEWDGVSTTHSCCSGHGTHGRPLHRSLSDGLLLELCI